MLGLFRGLAGDSLGGLGGGLLVLLVFHDDDVLLGLDLGFGLRRGGIEPSWVIAAGASPGTCARTRSMRNCDVSCVSSPKHSTRMP